MKRRVGSTRSIADLVDEAIKRLERAESRRARSPRTLRVHKLLIHGVPVEYRDARRLGAHDPASSSSTSTTPSNNDWLAVNQFTIIGNKNRRPDVLVFVNGIPLGLLELKNLADEHATLKNAWNQIQTYRNDIPAVFTPNAVTVISRRHQRRHELVHGRLRALRARGRPSTAAMSCPDCPRLRCSSRASSSRSGFLDIIKNFIVFSDEPNGLVKRVAKYHQYWAVNAAVESTVEAAGPDGDRRGGVVWHTQGSGKSHRDAALRRQDHARRPHEQPDAGLPDRPQRPR